MRGSKVISLITIRMNDKDAGDIIEAIEMAENEGVHNRASVLKTILETLLHKR